DKRFWCLVDPGGLNRVTQHSGPHGLQQNLGTSSPSPCSFGWDERGWSFRHELRLLIRVQHDNSGRFVRIKSREDLASDPEVGVVHMHRLSRLWEAQGELSKIFSGHDGPPFLSIYGLTMVNPIVNYSPHFNHNRKARTMKKPPAGWPRISSS